jgi:hypothetical protein
MRKVEYVFEHLPCAGITLFRFYGYHLSRSPFSEKHPEESENTFFQLKKKARQSYKKT